MGRPVTDVWVTTYNTIDGSFVHLAKVTVFSIIPDSYYSCERCFYPNDSFSKEVTKWAREMDFEFTGDDFLEYANKAVRSMYQ